MEWVALVTWVLTAGGGLFMLGVWLKHGGMRDSGLPGDRIRAARILSHFALAATGLVVWVVYVATDSEGLAWVAFALLAVVALLGFSMLAVWLRQRSREPAFAGAGAAGSVRGATPPEQHFPTAVVAVHGLFAVTTLVLVLLVAAGVGGS
jgi:ABC-type Na+ efflux pump permease subunit